MASHFNKLATVFTLHVLGAKPSCTTRNSQDSNVFPSGVVLSHALYLSVLADLCVILLSAIGKHLKT